MCNNSFTMFFLPPESRERHWSADHSMRKYGLTHCIVSRLERREKEPKQFTCFHTLSQQRLCDIYFRGCVDKFVTN
jgi:hypothetical protein